MFRQLSIPAARGALSLLIVVTLCRAQVRLGVPPAPVLTQRNDTNRTSTYVQEGFGPEVFAPQNQWGLVGALAVDGAIYAQPLCPGLNHCRRRA
jgi:hypothetical protein